MVAVIKTGTSLHRPFNYNENKVKEKHAVCIAAEGYPKDLPDLSLGNKLNLLLRQADLHRNIVRKAVHISLNFDPSEKEKLTDDLLCRIADDYMKGIGFGGQPYLVYRHTDAGHPHIHIVTTKIKADGLPIGTQNIGRLRSVPTSRRIEKEYGLVPAPKNQKQQDYKQPPLDALKINYGRTPIRRAIQGVLETVLKNYCYSSLQQLNAILKLYNMEAYPGAPGSRVNKHQGLYYRILDKKGDPIGIPIKASAIFLDMPQGGKAYKNHPTLDYLQSRYIVSKIRRNPHRSALKNAIDLALLKPIPGNSIQYFMDTLKKQGIDTSLHINESGRIYGITYIDHRSRSVFNGSDLGKEYGASAILRRCEAGDTSLKGPKFRLAGQEEMHMPIIARSTTPNNPPDYYTIPPEITDLLAKLFGPEYAYEPIPSEYRLERKKRRRKKRKGRS